MFVISKLPFCYKARRMEGVVILLVVRELPFCYKKAWHERDLA